MNNEKCICDVHRVFSLCFFFFATLIVAHAQLVGPTAGNTGQLVTTTRPVISGTAFGSAYRGIPYAGQIVVTGGTPPYTVTALGSLPNGLAFSGCTNFSPPPNCSITGSPTGAGASPFTLIATDSKGLTSNPLGTSITVSTATATAVTPTGRTIAQGSQLSMTCTSTETDNQQKNLTSLGVTVTWAVTGTTGSTITTAGVLTAGGTSGAAHVTCSFDGQTSLIVDVTITGGTGPVIGTTSLPNGQINQAYAEAITGPPPRAAGTGFPLACSGGTGPYTFQLASGALPGGITLNSASGIISGVATASGTFNPQFTCKDSLNVTSPSSPSLPIIIASVSPGAMASVDCQISPGCRTITPQSTVQIRAVANYSDGSTHDVTSLVIGGGPLSAPRVWNNIIQDAPTLHTSISQTVATMANSLVFVCVSQGSNNTDTMPITDSASQTTYTQTNSGYVDGGNTNRRGVCRFMPNSAALTSVTVNFSTPGGVINPTLMILEVVNAATSSAEDNNASVNSSGTNATSLASGAMNTTFANDIQIYWVRVNADQTNWVVGSGYTIPANNIAVGANGSDIRSAIQYQIVSATQSGATTSMGWNVQAGSALGIFTPIKGLATGGTVWDNALNCLNTAGNVVATVSATGSVTGQQSNGTTPATCNIRATLSGQTGSVTITVNPSAITGVTISPKPASGTVNSTVTFMLKDTGSPPTDHTAQSTFSSSMQSVATVPSGVGNNVVSCVGNGQTVITGNFQALHDDSTLTCQPQGTGGLLTGCTVSSSNTVQNCGGIPGGWTLVCAEGFDGPLNSCTDQPLSNNFASLDNGFGHNSSSSLKLTIDACFPTSGNPCSPGGWWATRNVPGINDIYISYWSHLDQNARTNVENFFASVYKESNPDQALIMDTEGPNDSFTTHPSLWFSPQTNSNSDCQQTNLPKNCGKYGGTFNLNLGSWEQEEVWIHPSTSSSNNDGFIRMYINGTQVYSFDSSQSWDCAPECNGCGNCANGGNFNGSVNMADGVNTVRVGGPWTYVITQPTAFTVHKDDIIVMKR